MTDTEQALETAVTDVRKDAENEIHPVVKSLWADFKGDLSEFKAWIVKEIEKL